MNPKIGRAASHGVLVELTVVVVGVLIALAADSAWQARVEAGRESVYVLALRADLADAREMIERTLDEALRQQQEVDAARAILRGSTDVAPEQPFGVSWPRVPIVRLTTVETLVATGDIRLLDSSIRREVVQQSSRLAAINNTLDRLFELASSNIRDWVIASARLEVASGRRDFGLQAARGDARVLAVFDLHAGLLSDLKGAMDDMGATIDELDKVNRPGFVGGPNP